MLSTNHRERIAAHHGDAASYIKAQGAVIADGHAYWIDKGLLWGLTAGRGPGWETSQSPAPWTVAMWEELCTLRRAVAETEAALRVYGGHDGGGLNMRWDDRDKVKALADKLASVRVADARQIEKERDEALAEVARLRAVLGGIAESARAAITP